MKKTAHPVLILSGPNLNLLGQREPKIYGTKTLKDLEALCTKVAHSLGLKVDCRQSNLEGELINWIQEARKKNSGIILNAGGYSHSSVAILDALTIADLPVIEVHISNIYRREKFRHHSLISKVAQGVICGFGFDGYTYALQAMAKLLKTTR